MKTYFGLGLAMLAGSVLGAAAVTGLNAQAKPPAYTVSEVDVTNPDGFTKEYLPLLRASMKNSGAKLLAGSEKVTLIEGSSVPKRVAIQEWESMDKFLAWRNSADAKAAREIGNKYATSHSYAIEGLPK